MSEGAELFRIYCAICHGADGAGEGQVSEYFRRIPDLTALYVRQYPDGRLYTVIRAGRSNMPGYAESLGVDERWAIVHYIRTLGSER
jgi:mono/diheme cytochrome c family protein